MMSRFPTLAAALLILLWTAACAEVTEGLDDVKQGLSKASDRLEGFFETGSLEPSAEEQADAAYQAGLGARKTGNDSEAFVKFLEAAEAGHGAAAYEVGLAYKDGRGTEPDLDASAKWINRAADRGEFRAQYLVGLAYYTGTGVKQDYEHAVRFLADAAAQGHPAAQFLFGQAFANGNGVLKNRARAARWYGKAAARGLAEAQFTYGVVRASGLGLPKNRVRGYTWLLLAERKGHEKAGEVRAALEDKMSPEQMARATLRADDFKPVLNAPFADPPTIMYVEHRLNDLGFDTGAVDGVNGKRTRAAITKYQQSRRLAADGRVSPELLDRLFAEQAGDS
jgi:TPR repeat protein